MTKQDFEKYAFTTLNELREKFDSVEDYAEGTTLSAYFGNPNGYVSLFTYNESIENPSKTSIFWYANEKEPYDCSNI